MALHPPSMTEQEVLLEEAWKLQEEELLRRYKTLVSSIADTEARIKSISNKRWLVRERADQQTLLETLRKSVEDVEKKLETGRGDIHTIQKQYSKALADMTKSRVNKMVSSSMHSAARTFRKNNIVLMAPENAEECVRQHLRAELGLQEKPLLLTAGDVCDDCGTQMTIVSNDSMLSCPSCHKLRLLPNTMTTSALHGTDVETNNSITKHRLPEWIEMAQAKEFTEPPMDIVESVARFMIKNSMTGLEAHQDLIQKERKERGPFKSAADAILRLSENIPDLSAKLMAINANAARIALKGLVTYGQEKYRKFYERSAKVASLIGGYWPPRMNSQQEELLRLLYTHAAPQYEKRRKPKQTYWPGGFPFFLRCVCVLLGWDEFAAEFPIPPGTKEGGSRDLLRNEIWSDLDWELVNYTGSLPPMKLPSGEQWSMTLDDDEDGGGVTASGESTKQIKKEVESKIAIRKRKRVDVELECV